MRIALQFALQFLILKEVFNGTRKEVVRIISAGVATAFEMKVYYEI